METVEGERLEVGQKGVVDSEATTLDAIDEDQIKLCVRWLTQAEATSIPTLNSFWLKHVIENWAGTSISNGAVILAAYRMGIPIGRDADCLTANVTVAVAPQSVDEFDCGCGHP